MKIRNTLCALLLGLCATAAAFASDPPVASAEKPSVFEGGITNALITLIIFGIVVAVLGKKAWPQIIRTLNEREAAIRGALDNARREREAAEKLLAEYKRQIDQARQEATSIVDEGRRDAEEVRRRIQEEARTEANESIARAKREIQLATDTAVKELYDRTAELAIQVAGGVLRKQLSPQDHGDLVRQAMDEIKASGKTSLN